MKKSFLIFLCMLVIGFGFIGCFDDDDDPSDKAETGTIKVTIATAQRIVGYPKWDSNKSVYLNADDDKDTPIGCWQYPAVDPTMAVTKIGLNNIDNPGTLKYYVYLFSIMQDTAKDLPILYSGEADTDGENPVTITISNVAVGSYYIVAFYDYADGGQVTNVLNRYDRYSFYLNGTSDFETPGTDFSSPYYEDASLVTITKDQTLAIPSSDTTEYIKIKRNWVLGQPGKGNGRKFLSKTESNDIPVAVP